MRIPHIVSSYKILDHIQTHRLFQLIYYDITSIIIYKAFSWSDPLFLDPSYEYQKLASDVEEILISCIWVS